MKTSRTQPLRIVSLAPCVLANRNEDSAIQEACARVLRGLAESTHQFPALGGGIGELLRRRDAGSCRSEDQRCPSSGRKARSDCSRMGSNGNESRLGAGV